MPRYFFNVHNDDFTEDFEGSPLSDLDAARVYATRSARSLAADTVADGHLFRDHYVEILDEDRRPLAKVAFGEAVVIR